MYEDLLFITCYHGKQVKLQTCYNKIRMITGIRLYLGICMHVFTYIVYYGIFPVYMLYFSKSAKYCLVVDGYVYSAHALSSSFFIYGYYNWWIQLLQEKLKMVTVLGAGLLVGTALAVIIPEGVHAMYNNGGGKAHSMKC